MVLSKRLKTIADMVTPHLTLADIGTDHGYVPIYLLENKIISHAIAMDISADCLAKARINIKKAGLGSYAEFRVSDGFSALCANEAQSVIIAGMGGNMMCDILNRAVFEHKLDGVREIILSPHRDAFALRNTIYKIGYKISDEKIVYEDGKFYFCIKAESNNSQPGKIPNYTKNRINLEFGQILLERKDKVLKDYLIKRKEQYETILAGKISGKDREAICEKQKLVTEALNLLE